MRRRLPTLLPPREYTILALLVFLAVALTTSSTRTSMDGPRLAVLAIVAKAARPVAAIEQWVKLGRENTELRRINAQLVLDNAILAEARAENERLRALLGFTTQAPLDYVPARVIGTSTQGFVNCVILDVGSGKGLRKNMPVVCAEGLVGKLYTVGRDQSLAQLLTDRNARVSARVQRSRVTGIVRSVHANLFLLEQVPKRADVRVGDVVVTSGLTPMFPAGLKIGTVSAVSEEAPGLFMTISLLPAADFSRLEELLVVRSPAEASQALKP
ncbi:MAG: rod shape-determining protein MreC [Calditrichaeota bacterium]|nr:rod shape-determining protein MreC [Calditrichota bacterium]